MWETTRQAVVLVGRVPTRWALLAASLYLASVFLAAIRWRGLLRALCRLPGAPKQGVQEEHQSSQTRAWDAVQVLFASIFVNNITPARIAGEVFRVAAIRKRVPGADLALVTASVGYDRLMDSVALTILGVAAFAPMRMLVGEAVGRLVAAALSSAMGLFALVFLIFALSVLLVSKLRSVRSFFSGQLERFRRFQLGRGALLLGVVLSLVVWSLDQVRLMVIAGVFGIKLSFLQAVTLSLVGLFGALLPTIGGIGAVEGGLIGALTLYGVGAEAAIAITLFERAISFVFASGIGALSLVSMGGQRLLKS